VWVLHLRQAQFPALRVGAGRRRDESDESHVLSTLRRLHCRSLPCAAGCRALPACEGTGRSVVEGCALPTQTRRAQFPPPGGRFRGRAETIRRSLLKDSGLTRSTSSCPGHPHRGLHVPDVADAWPLATDVDDHAVGIEDLILEIGSRFLIVLDCRPFDDGAALLPDQLDFAFRIII
jgi:hypothetical protein